jgi:hypothetical protein
MTKFLGDDAIFHATAVTPFGRELLTANRTYFIDNVNGNDANDGLAAGTGRAFASFGKATAVIFNNLDVQGFTVTIQAASGQTWTNLTAKGEIVGGGLVTFDAGGGTVTGNIANGAALLVGLANGAGFSNTFFNFQNGMITASAGSHGLQISGGLVSTNASVTFGACGTGVHIFCDSAAARYLALANYSISGGALYHYYAFGGGLVDVNNSSLTVTVTGTPAFGNAFAGASRGGILFGYATYSGAATGTRYAADSNGVIDSNGGGANHFPGSVPGTTSTGGQYI